MPLVSITQLDVDNIVTAINNRAKSVDMTTALNGKQNTLVAGTNISIVGNTISANDTAVAFSEITAKPTTIAGYGITDATPSAHVGATGTAHGTATTAVAGFMSSTDKTKLDGVAAGAQVNAVTTVAGRTGAVVLAKGDVGLGSVDNTTDALKPISIATQTALSAKQDKLIAGTNITIGADGKTISANDTSVAFTEITDKPTTLSGYGITDGSSLAVARPTKVSATSINVNGTVLTVVSPVAGKDYFFSKTAITTTKQPDTIGGFHYGVIPTDFSAINNITQADAEAIRGINAYSIWTNWFRPICDPSGMIYVNGRWYDIYPTNTDHHLYGTSAAGKTIAAGVVLNGRNYPKIPLQFGGNGSVTYGSMTWFEAAEIAKAHSKDLISYNEFVAIAYGVLEGSSAGAADTGITQHLANYTSKFGICMATGCQFIWGKDLHMRPDGTGWAWHAETEGRGTFYAYQYGPTAAIFGGYRDAAAERSGSRASDWANYVWFSYWHIGCRFACDHLELA